MKNNSLTNRILHFAKIFIIRYSIFNCVLFFVACEMTKELDIEQFSFPPKLAVTAILDGENGVFDINIKESLSLAEYNRRTLSKENIRNGEIRLYEDDVLIRTISGPFDMSTELSETGNGWVRGKNGYRRSMLGINTHPGNVYRLEVEVEGYPMAVATSVMPTALVVSASMDTSVQVIKKHVKEIGTVGYWLSHMASSFNNENYPVRYWPFSINIVDAGAISYCTLDILHWYESSNNTFGLRNWGIGGSDASILLETGMDRGLLNSEQVDLYLFPMLMLSDFKDATRQFFAAVIEIPNNPKYDDSYLDDNPDVEKITTWHSLNLRVRNITPATYRYYHSLSLQYADDMFTEQPATVVSNIEGGYGSFSVFNTTSIPLLEWETYEYRIKEE